MKKVFIILLLALALVFTLAACNNPDKTYASPRWKNETHTFNISKALTEDSTVVRDGVTFIKEPGASNYEPNLETADEVVPEDVRGTYTMKIAVNETDKTCTFTTEQTLYVSYPTSLLISFSIWDTPDENGNKLSDKVVPLESAENPFPVDGTYTTLKSTTVTKVVFRNDASQRPFSSENHVDGFYIGKTAQTISKYDLQTTYEWSEKNKVTISVNGEKQETTGTYTEKFIDANQILLYVRSLDKTNSSFKDGPTVSVYMPKTDKVVRASFIYTYSCNTSVTVGSEDVFVKLNAVCVVVDGTALLMQLNVPEYVNGDGKFLDSIPNVGSSADKYSTLRFRSGIFSYHLSDFGSLENGSEILEAIKVKPAPKDEQ